MKDREMVLLIAALLTAGELANPELVGLVGGNVKRALKLIEEVEQLTPESEGWR